MAEQCDVVWCLATGLNRTTNNVENFQTRQTLDYFRRSLSLYHFRVIPCEVAARTRPDYFICLRFIAAYLSRRYDQYVFFGIVLIR